MRELHAPQNPHMPVQFPFEPGSGSYAMGWGRTLYRGHAYLAHGGGMIGFPSYVALLPDARAGVAVLSNSPEAMHRAVALWALDRVLGEPEHDWNGEFLRHAHEV